MWMALPQPTANTFPYVVCLPFQQPIISAIAFVTMETASCSMSLSFYMVGALFFFFFFSTKAKKWLFKMALATPVNHIPPESKSNQKKDRTIKPTVVCLF